MREYFWIALRRLVSSSSIKKKKFPLAVRVEGVGRPRANGLRIRVEGVGRPRADCLVVDSALQEPHGVVVRVVMAKDVNIVHQGYIYFWQKYYISQPLPHLFSHFFVTHYYSQTILYCYNFILSPPPHYLHQEVKGIYIFFFYNI